jgi:hypothetical protein
LASSTRRHHRRAARLASNGEAAEFLTPLFTNLERRQNIWG